VGSYEIEISPAQKKFFGKSGSVMLSIKNLFISSVFLSLGFSNSPAKASNVTITNTNLEKNLVLNLSDSMKLVEESSPQVKRTEAQKSEANAKKKEAFAIFLPRLNLVAQHLLDEKFIQQTLAMGSSPVTIDLIQPYSLLSLRGEWGLFDGFSNVDFYQAQTLAATAAEKEAEWAHFQVRQEAKQKFFKALAAVEIEKVANQNVKTLTDHLERAKALRQSGVGTNFDVLRVEVQLNESQTERLNSEDNVVLSKLALLNLLGLDDLGQFISGSLPVPTTTKVLQVEKPTAMDRIDFQAISDRELSAHKSFSVAHKHWIPKLSMVAQADYYNNISQGVTDQDYASAYSVGLNLTWNLFDGFAPSSRAVQAEAREAQAVATKRQAYLKNKYDFDFWKRRYLYSASLYKAKTDDVEKAQESVRLATQSFKAGARTSSDVLDAELDLFRARAGVVNAQVNAVEALVNLELALGKEL
jgi:outer membrane protein TolC